MVHVTISDFMLNLDPTSDDVWTLNGADGGFTYDNATAGDTNFSFGNDDTGVFKIVEVDEENPVAAVCRWIGDKEVTFEETGSNTGVFESDDGDVSEISINDAPLRATPLP